VHAGAAPATSAGLVRALARDFAVGRGRGHTAVDLMPAIGPPFDELLAGLPAAEKRRFTESDFIVYRRLVRHTSPDYAAAADRLARTGQLRCVRGRVVDLIARPGRLDVRIERDAAPHTLRAAAVVDCRGFTGVRRATNPVVADLIGSGAVAANPCGRGLLVNDRFEAAPGLFVLGPALAGTALPNIAVHIWSLENIPRIHALAERVAAGLWTDLCTDHCTDHRTHHARPVAPR
jgi:uncharacterized NAD(P)/FAD-binding protein YdhS